MAVMGLPGNVGAGRGDAQAQLRAIMQQDTLSAAERVALASMQVLQPMVQELLSSALMVHESWLINDVSAALETAGAAGERVAGYDPAALGMIAAAFNSIIAAADTSMGEGLPTPRQALMKLYQQVEG